MANVGRPKKPPTPKKMLKEVFPVEDIFDEKEAKIYNDLVNVYLDDFDEDLTSSDMDDIFELCRNKVFEFRLSAEMKNNVDKQLDFAAAQEKLAKRNEKIKESLSARRKDRINPNEFKGFSIVDLAVAYNNDKKLKMREKLNILKKEEASMLEKRKDYHGNKHDIDVDEDDRDGQQ